MRFYDFRGVGNVMELFGLKAKVFLKETFDKILIQSFYCGCLLPFSIKNHNILYIIKSF